MEALNHLNITLQLFFCQPSTMFDTPYCMWCIVVIFFTKSIISSWYFLTTSTVHAPTAVKFHFTSLSCSCTEHQLRHIYNISYVFLCNFNITSPLTPSQKGQYSAPEPIKMNWRSLFDWLSWLWWTLWWSLTSDFSLWAESLTGCLCSPNPQNVGHTKAWRKGFCADTNTAICVN